MSIRLPQGFNVRSREPIDKRLLLSKSEMIGMNDNVMPNTYFAICLDDNCIYIYNKSEIPDEETGKFRLYQSGNDSVDILNLQEELERLNQELENKVDLIKNYIIECEI